MKPSLAGGALAVVLAPVIVYSTFFTVITLPWVRTRGSWR